MKRYLAIGWMSCEPGAWTYTSDDKELLRVKLSTFDDWCLIDRQTGETELSEDAQNTTETL